MMFKSQIISDLLVYTMLLLAGRAIAVGRRARQLAMREAQLETDVARARLEALRLEIQPHFLFNTLNSIAALIRIRANDQALKMLLGLGELMRATIDRTPSQVTTWPIELDFTKGYIELQQVRFGDRLDVAYAIEPADRRLPGAGLPAAADRRERLPPRHRRQGRPLPARTVRGHDRADACASPCATTARACRPASISDGMPAPASRTSARACRTSMAARPRSASPRRLAAAHSSPSTCRRSRPPISREPRHERLPGPGRRRRAAGPGDGRRHRAGGSRRGLGRRVRRRAPGARADRRAPAAHPVPRHRDARDVGHRRRRDGRRRRAGDRVRDGVQPVRHARLRREGDRLRAEAVLGRPPARSARARQAAHPRTAAGRAGARAVVALGQPARSPRAGGRPRREDPTCSAWPSRSAIGRWC